MRFSDFRIFGVNTFKYVKPIISAIKEQTFNLSQKRKHTNIIFKRVPLNSLLFLEFGKHKDNKYTYISLLQGDIEYFGSNRDTHNELYFAFKNKESWRLLDSTCCVVVEDYKTEEQVIQRITELAELL